MLKNKKTEKVKPPLLARNHLSIALSFLLFSCIYFPLQAQTIPPYFISGNAWMPDSIGDGVNKVYLGGKIHNNWENVKQSNVKWMRFAGTAADFNRPSKYQYLRIVDSIRAKGMEPILQLSYGDGDVTVGDTGTALPILRYINITMGRNVKYWSIGNEPDLYDNDTTAAKISAYIKRYAIGMKKIDSTIRIFGPEMARMSVDAGDPLFKAVDTLTTWGAANSIVGLIPAGNGMASGKAYCDYFSYHMYNYDGAGTNTKTRAWLIARLTAATKDTARMGWLKRRLDVVNANRSTQPIKPVITEANICTQGNGSQPADDVFLGVKASSFFAGQHVCEAMAMGVYQGIQALNLWSSMEGNGMGYMTNSTSPTKKSTYYHMKAMGQWFSNIYLGTDNQTNIKAFGSKDANHIVVMILNQDTITAAAKPYTINLNNTSPGTTTWITMAMSVSKSYTDTIDASSTTLLEFDLNGNISQKYTYKQSLNNSPPGFQQNTCASSITYANQAALNNYIPSTYSSITIGDGTQAVTIDSTVNSIYRAVNSITINKNFTMPLGQTLSITTTPCN